MSADSWTTCPRCADRLRKTAEAERDAVMALYGKVPMEEFDAKRAALPDPEMTERTFREDYEFYGAETGTLEISYGGVCTECGLSVNVQESKRFWPEENGILGSRQDREFETYMEGSN